MHQCEAVEMIKRSVTEWNDYRNSGGVVPDLDGVNLNGYCLKEIDLHDCKLAGALLSDANLTRADLRKANLQGAKLSHANLRDASFIGCDARDSTFAMAKAQGALFCHADFSRANLNQIVCDNADFTRVKGLYGRDVARIELLEGVEEARFGKRYDVFSWGKLRAIGSLPLFEASYTGILGIWIWASTADVVNRSLSELRKHSPGQIYDAVRKIQNIPVPREMGFTLVALLLLAFAATLYRLLCPTEIQESSETRWRYELNQKTITYRSLSYRYCCIRLLTAFGYIVGGPWVMFLIGKRVVATVIYLMS
jgi:Pentapeptide repeats (8 copies)